MGRQEMSNLIDSAKSKPEAIQQLMHSALTSAYATLVAVRMHLKHHMPDAELAHVIAKIEYALAEEQKASRRKLK